MSRGCDEFTVQQLLNFLGEKLCAIDEQMPELHRKIGYALMDGGGSEVRPQTVYHVNKVQEANALRTALQQLAWDIEREAGRLHDVRSSGQTPEKENS
jgi:hypothetical protein